MHKARSQQLLGFTIFELLVVIVVIGILAAITIVSYTGISKQATVASLQSDLTTASKQLKMFRVDQGTYPATISMDCTASPTTTTNLCLTASPGSTYTDYQVDDVSNPQSFALTEMKSSLYYSIADDGQPAFVASAAYWKQLSVKLGQACAIGSDNQAYCWGRNTLGQLGNNSTTQSQVPSAVSTAGALSGMKIRSISVGAYHTCAIASDNQAYCWGRNANGQLGNNSTTQSLVPVAVTTSGVLSGKTLKSISAGGGYTCAIASDNQAYCWGSNGSGSLGNNSTTDSPIPVAVSTSGALSGKTLKSLSADSSTCAIASDNQAYCWGYNGYGLLGNNSNTNSTIPVAVGTTGALSGKTIQSIAPGGDHTCAIASDSQAYCWGFNGQGQLGNNSTTQSWVPVAVSTAGVLSGKTIVSITPGGNQSTCAIASDSQAYCWGFNGQGQFGNNSTTGSLVPVAASNTGSLSGKALKLIKAGDYHVCAIASDSQAYCWGTNSNGQLGNNSTTDSLVPVAVIPLGS